MKDYRYALPAMMSVKNGESRYFNRGDQHLMNEILARVRAEGKIGYVILIRKIKKV